MFHSFYPIANGFFSACNQILFIQSSLTSVKQKALKHEFSKLIITLRNFKL